jgi:hypothetical protein
VARVRRALWASVAALAAACGHDASLDSRIAALEQRADAAAAEQQRLAAVLREHGIVFHAGAPRDAAEAQARALDELDRALMRVQSARESQDHEQGRNALAALQLALERLREHGDALPALLAKAEVAPPARQPDWLECAARAGGAGSAGALAAIARDPAKPPGYRVAAARALLTADAAAAVPVVAELLREPTALPDLYLLVHMLAATARPDVAPVLVDALRRSADRSVRCHAATGLGGFRDTDAVEALATAATGDEYPAVRVNALRALVRAAPPERVREVAARAANDADAAVRKVATELADPAKR